MKIKIKTVDIKTPRWRMDIKGLENITYTENQLIDEIAMLLEQYNAKIDIQREERENQPFN